MTVNARWDKNYYACHILGYERHIMKNLSELYIERYWEEYSCSVLHIGSPIFLSQSYFFDY